jgi:hypothetical protein
MAAIGTAIEKEKGKFYKDYNDNGFWSSVGKRVAIPGYLAFSWKNSLKEARQASIDAMINQIMNESTGPLNEREFNPGEVIKGVDDFRAIGASWWVERYGRPPHWEK